MYDIDFLRLYERPARNFDHQTASDVSERRLPYPGTKHVTRASILFAKTIPRAALEPRLRHERATKRSLENLAAHRLPRQSPRRTEIRRGKMPHVVHVFLCHPLGKGGILFQRSRDRLEISVEGRTDTVHRSDDRNRDTGCDQTVFNRGCPRLIRQELRD